MTIPLPVLTGVFRCTFVWTPVSGGPAPVNVIHIKAASGTPTPTDAWNVINATVTAGMWSSTATGARVTRVDIIKLDGSSATTSFPTSGTGVWLAGSGGDSVPQVAFLIKISTGLRGRNRRGRVYIPLAGENNILSGTLLTSPQTILSNAWDGWRVALAAQSPIAYAVGVASYDRAHGGAGAAFTPATLLACENYTATQRRRQPGRKVSRH